MKKNIISALSLVTMLTLASPLAGCSSNSSSQAPEPMTQPIITDNILPEGQSGTETNPTESGTLSTREAESQPSVEAVLPSSAPSSAETAPQSASTGHNSHSSEHSSYNTSTVPNSTTAQTSGASVTAPSPTAAANTSPSLSAHDGELVTDYYLIKAELDALDIDKDNLEAAYRIGKLDEASFRSQKSLLEAEEDRLDDAKDLAKSTRHGHGEHTTYEGSKEELIVRLYSAKQKDDEVEKAIEQLEEDYRTGAITREDFIDRQARLLFEEDIVDQEKDSLEHSLEQMGWDD